MNGITAATPLTHSLTHSHSTFFTFLRLISVLITIAIYSVSTIRYDRARGDTIKRECKSKRVRETYFICLFYFNDRKPFSFSFSVNLFRSNITSTRQLKTTKNVQQPPPSPSPPPYTCHTAHTHLAWVWHIKKGLHHVSSFWIFTFDRRPKNIKEN